MVEVVVEDLVAVLGVLHGKVITGTNKEEISHNISDHLLVEVTVIDMFPIGILKSPTLMINQRKVLSNLENDGIFL